MLVPGKVIVIEGPDRVGKATQSALLIKHLTDKGYHVAHQEIPNYESWSGMMIDWMLKNGTAKTFKRMFQLLQFINKWRFQSTINQLRTENDFVILDRWALSSVIYGTASGIESWFVNTLYNMLLTPTATLILHGSAFPRTNLDSYEKDVLLQQNVRKLYWNWAVEHPYSCYLIDINERSRDEVFEIVLGTLELKGVVSP